MFLIHGAVFREHNEHTALGIPKMWIAIFISLEVQMSVCFCVGHLISFDLYIHCGPFQLEYQFEKCFKKLDRCVSKVKSAKIL